MTDKERLESIKEDIEIGIKVWGISIDDIKWLVRQTEEKIKLEKENDRYRAYLESIRMTGTYGMNIHTNEMFRSDEAELAEEALRGRP